MRGRREVASLAAGIALICLWGAPLSGQHPGGAVRVAAPATAPVGLTRFRSAAQSFTQFSGIDDSTRLVIRDSTTWRRYWSAIHRPFIPAPPMPAVDFSREMIVLVAMGTRPTAGFDIRIDSVLAEAGRMVVSVRRQAPGSGCAVPAVVTQPVDIVRLPASDAPVWFAERGEQTECPRR